MFAVISVRIASQISVCCSSKTKLYGFTLKYKDFISRYYRCTILSTTVKIHPSSAVISPARGPLPALLDWPLSHPATCPPPSQMGLLWKICDINTVNSNVNFRFPWMIMSLMHQDKYVSSHPKHKQNWLNSPNSKLSIKLDCAHTQITNRNVTLTSIKRRIF